MEYSYKLQAIPLKYMVNDREITKNEALEYYKEAAEMYVKRLNELSNHLTLQIVLYIIIYVINIACGFIVYKKFLNNA